MKHTKTLIAASLLGALGTSASAQILYAVDGSTYSENFNHGYSTGSTAWTDNSFIPGYYLYRTAGNGSTPTPAGAPTNISITNTYSAGNFSLVSSPSDTSNWALGGMLTDGTSGAPATVGNGYYIGLRLTNTTGTTLTSFSLSYTGATYSNTNATAMQSIEVTYQTGTGITLASTGWQATSPSLTYTSALEPVSSTTAVDFATTSVVSTATISGVSWANGTDLWIRFFIDNVGGIDRGVAIDNINFSATAVPEPSTFALLAGAAVLTGAVTRRRPAMRR